MLPLLSPVCQRHQGEPSATAWLKLPTSNEPIPRSRPLQAELSHPGFGCSGSATLVHRRCTFCSACQADMYDNVCDTSVWQLLSAVSQNSRGSAALRAPKAVYGQVGDRQHRGLVSLCLLQDRVSKAAGSSQGSRQLMRYGGGFTKAHSTDPNLIISFWQHHPWQVPATYRLPDSLRENPWIHTRLYTEKLVLLNHLFPLSKAWRGRCLSVSILSLKSLQLKENLPIF